MARPQRLEEYPEEAGGAAGGAATRASASRAVNPEKNRFPFALVWGPLPVITWLLPFIGHMGVCDSEGRVHDFAGPYFVGIDQFMTGSVHKYFQFDVPAGEVRAWDDAVRRADKEYREMMHNLCCNNCHHHSARALTHSGRPLTMMGAWWLLQTRGRYVSWGHLVSTYLPFLFLVALVALVVSLA